MVLAKVLSCDRMLTVVRVLLCRLKVGGKATGYVGDCQAVLSRFLW